MLAEFLQNLTGEKGPSSIVNNIAIYEANHLALKSFSNPKFLIVRIFPTKIRANSKCHCAIDTKKVVPRV